MHGRMEGRTEGRKSEVGLTEGRESCYSVLLCAAGSSVGSTSRQAGELNAVLDLAGPTELPVEAASFAANKR